eukprot:GFYU01000802.1.p1 GENE.GFYU01000802.1~~GFYU01000802.1.p1  ORF type:complete len:265 (-),score=74.78 GFYU01000802.1:191-931(-)
MWYKAAAVVAFLTVCAVALHQGNFFSSENDWVSLNIHVTLPEHNEADIMAFAADINKDLPNNEITFDKYQPHATLYLTHFKKAEVPNVIAAMKNLVKNDPKFSGCASSINKKYATPEWGFLGTELTDCLRYMSDTTVKATMGFIYPPEIPAWVEKLPPKVRKLKEAMIKKYGSPNVFAGFEPHVTCAGDKSKDPTEVAALASAFSDSDARFPDRNTFEFLNLAISPEGPWGTVPRNTDIASWSISK